MYTRRQLRREAALTEADLEEIRQCRRPHNRLGFAYQLSFVRLLNRFPNQQPFEVVEELAIFTSVQLSRRRAASRSLPYSGRALSRPDA